VELCQVGLSGDDNFLHTRLKFNKTRPQLVKVIRDDDISEQFAAAMCEVRQ